MHANAKEWLAFFAVLGVSLFLSLTFYNQTMYGPDDGYYAYIAERINQGALYGRDVTGFHPGYIHYFHAFVTSLFGENFLSLRYPLIIITLLQTALAFLMFKDKSVVLASLAALTVSCFSFILFPNPAANWYCTFLIVAGLFIIQKLKSKPDLSVFLIGIIIGLSFMFRHLSGIFIAGGFMMYIVSSLIFDANDKDTKPRAIDVATMRAVLIALIAPFIIYILFLSRGPDLFAQLTFALWPVLYVVLLWQTSSNAPAANTLIRTIAIALFGSICAVLPMIILQGINGNLGGWITSIIDQSMSIPATSIEDAFQYSYLLRMPIVYAMDDPSLDRSINLILFFILPLLTAINGIFLLAFTALGKRPNPFLIIGAFYAYSALYLQIPSYLFYMIAFPILGILSAIWSLESEKQAYLKPLAIATTLFICITTPYYHAGQTVHRSFAEYVGGVNSRDKLVQSTLPKVSLSIEEETQNFYAELIRIIQSETSEDQSILAFPFNPEIYYFSDRKNITNATSTLHVNSEEALEAFDLLVKNEKPTLIIHSVNDKYNTAYTEKFANMIKNNYNLISGYDYNFAKFEIYKNKDSH